MPITIDAQESGLFQAGVVEGRREGVIEGMLELKYGSFGLELMDIVRIIDAAGKSGKLDEFKNLIRKSASLDILKEFLEKNK